MFKNIFYNILSNRRISVLLSVSHFRSLYRPTWYISLPFNILQLVKSPPFLYTWNLKKVPLSGGAPSNRPLQGLPTFLGEHLHRLYRSVPFPFVNQDRWKILSRKTFITLNHLLNYLSIYFRLPCRRLLSYFLCCHRNKSVEVQPLTLLYTPFRIQCTFYWKMVPLSHTSLSRCITAFCC